MNARELGPNIPLAADADPSDGKLDVVLVKPGDRESFARYLGLRLKGQTPAPPQFDTRRTGHVRFEHVAERLVHVDDEILTPTSSARFSAQATGQVTLLVPKPPGA